MYGMYVTYIQQVHYDFTEKVFLVLRVSRLLSVLYSSANKLIHTYFSDHYKQSCFLCRNKCELLTLCADLKFMDNIEIEITWKLAINGSRKHK